MSTTNEIKVNFNCPDDIRPHLQQVFAGEYNIPLEIEAPAIIDLGANCGAFTIWAAHRWPGATISAYEPHPDNFKYLTENTQNMSKVFRHNLAIGTPGVRILNDGRFNGGEVSLHEIKNNPNPTGRHIEVESPFVLPEAHIIKLDVEGCEYEILQPLIDQGRNFAAVLLEWHSDGLRRAVDELLKDYALVKSEVYYIGGRGLSCYLHNELVKGL